MQKKLYINVDSSTKGENSLNLKKTQRGNVKGKILKSAILGKMIIKKFFTLSLNILVFI